MAERPPTDGELVLEFSAICAITIVLIVFAGFWVWDRTVTECRVTVVSCPVRSGTAHP